MRVRDCLLIHCDVLAFSVQFGNSALTLEIELQKESMLRLLLDRIENLNEIQTPVRSYISHRKYWSLCAHRCFPSV